MSDATGFPPRTIIIKPARGMNRFRRNASMAFDGEALVATDRRRRSARFLLHSGDDAPARAELIMNGDHLVVIDGRGQTLVLTRNVDWDTEESGDLFDAAGIPVGVRTAPPPVAPLRADGIRLEDARYPNWVAVAATGGLPVGMLAANHVIPIPLAIPYFVFVFGGTLWAWIGGYWSKPRESPDMADYRRLVAQGRAKREAKAQAAREARERKKHQS